MKRVTSPARVHPRVRWTSRTWTLLAVIWVLMTALAPAANTTPVAASNAPMRIAPEDPVAPARQPSVKAGRASRIDSVNLSVTKAALPDPDGVRRVGDTVTFTMTIRNGGTTNIILLPVDDTYDPARLSYQSATPTPNEFPPPGTASGILKWYDLAPGLPGGQLAPNASTVLTVTFRLWPWEQPLTSCLSLEQWTSSIRTFRL